MARRKPKVTFESLSQMRQESRNPCGRSAYNLGSAHAAARTRNALDADSGKKWWVTVCFDGCGRSIFHLTNQQPTGRASRRMNENVPPPQLLAQRVTPAQRSRKARKRERTQRNQERNAALVLGTWQDDGGALHPSELDG